MSWDEWNVHLGRGWCFLCKQPASPGSVVSGTFPPPIDKNNPFTKVQLIRLSDLHNNQATVPECERYPKCKDWRSTLSNQPVWHHCTCYDILNASNDPCKTPTSNDLRRFACAIRPLYKLTLSRMVGFCMNLWVLWASSKCCFFPVDWEAGYIWRAWRFAGK